MSLSSSPRKTVPLATGDEPRARSKSITQSTTKRVFFCGVVVEGSENGRRLPDEIQDLVLSLGQPISDSTSEMFSSPGSAVSNPESTTQRKRALTDTSALSSVITELVSSERTYVKRLQILKNDYADPLRNFARSKETAIIPAYEAKTLFGNIDNLLPVNETFLLDLEKMLAPNGPKTVGGVGDVALRHFKDLRGFEQYKQYYVKREEAQLIFEREVSKRSSRFAAYIDHIKYQSTDPKNRVGLRELLMEPVQRIPRYTLLFRTMLKHMAPDDPQRANILEADEIASKIALAEADEQTKRAAVFYCLIATIDGFPPDLFSNSRRFIDCIDVEDVLSDTTLSTIPSSTANTSNSLHCTLLLFEDKLVIVKRPGNGEKGGKALIGLDELDKVTKAGGIPSGKKKSGMSCKGVMDVTDVVVTDVGGSDFHLYLENPPQDQTERWSGRPFRALTVVNPPAPANTESDKQRFLENLWHVQAMYRSRAGQSVVLRADEQEVESRGGKATIARTYFNVYQRTAFLQEQKKTKIVVHIDPLGSSDPIPFGIGAPPFARIRVQPLAGGLSRYSVSSTDPTDEAEEDIVQTERVPNRVIQTIHQFGLFEFKTGINSIPSTPTSRSRAAIFGLDAISRNLFASRPGSAMGDFFGGSINGHRRAKSSTSRTSSIYTQTTTTTSMTGDGSLAKFSSRSGSTVATTIYSMDDESPFFSKSSKGSKMLLKQSRSPSASASESESQSRPVSREGSLTVPTGPASLEYSDYEDEDGTIQEKIKDIDSSDYNLAMQLELARQNSLNQQPKPSLSLEIPVTDTIYEEEPPHSLRPPSAASIGHNSRRSITPLSESPSKQPHSPCDPASRPLSRQSERRPIGPRSPSPLPLLAPPSPEADDSSELPYLSDDPGYDSPPRNSPPRRTPPKSQSPERQEPSQPVLPADVSDPPTPILRGKRPPFYAAGNIETTPKASRAGVISNTSNGISATNAPASAQIEPLSIKKKNSVRVGGHAASPLARKVSAKGSPFRSGMRVVSPRKVSPQFQTRKGKGSSHSHSLTSNTSNVDAELSEALGRMSKLTVSTKEDIESSQRVIKKIKVEVGSYRSNAPRPSYDEPPSRPPSPDKSLRSSVQNPTTPLTKEAQRRMEEMRALIGKRQTSEFQTIARTRSSIFEQPPRSMTPVPSDDVSRKLEELVSDADKNLMQALSRQETLQNELKNLMAELKEKAKELDRVKFDLQSSKRQCEVMKSLWTDVTAEKDIIFEAFNEELDSMYNDASLPEDEAWVALTKDLRKTKEARNNLSKENSVLKAKVAEIESQHTEWGNLLRAHNLIS